MRILIGIPSAGDVEAETLKSVYGLDKCGHEVMLDIVYGYTVDANRNTLAQEAVDDGYDYIFFVDNDVVLPSDALAKLLEIRVDIVSGIYRSHQQMGDFTQLSKYGETINYLPEDSYTSAEFDAMDSTRVEVRGGGAGCMLISTAALKRIGKPWFKWTEYESGGTLSEDLWFCEQAHDADVPIYADPRVRCGHIIKQTYWC